MNSLTNISGNKSDDDSIFSSSDNLSSILDSNIHNAIDELSDDSGSEEEDFTLAKGFERVARELKTTYGKTAEIVTEEDMVQALKAKHIYAALYKSCPPGLCFILDTLKSLQLKLAKKLTPSLKTCMSIYTSIYSTFQLTFHLLYLASFSCQLLLSNTHRLILHFDNVLSAILNDRVKEIDEDPVMQAERKTIFYSCLDDGGAKNPNPYAPILRPIDESDDDSTVTAGTIKTTLSASQQSLKSQQSSQQSSQHSGQQSSTRSSQHSFKSEHSSQQSIQQSSTRSSQQSFNSQRSSLQSNQTVESATSVKKSNIESKPVNPVKHIVEYVEDDSIVRYDDLHKHEFRKKQEKRNKPKGKPRSSIKEDQETTKNLTKEKTGTIEFKPADKHFWRGR
jgi:hypothetical protein